jgi:hypothetical protein
MGIHRRRCVTQRTAPLPTLRRETKKNWRRARKRRKKARTLLLLTRMSTMMTKHGTTRERREMRFRGQIREQRRRR